MLNATLQHRALRGTASIPQILHHAHQHISSDYAKSQYLEFLAEVCQRRVSFPAVASSTNEDAIVVAQYIESALRAVITAYCQSEPQRPTNFSLAPKSCDCTDCQPLNAFLASPTETQFDVRGAQGRRKHLDNVFMYCRDGHFKVETVKTGRPHIWRIMKTLIAIYSQDYKRWKARVNDLKKKLTIMAAATDSLLSADNLGSAAYKAVMTGTVEGLGSTGRDTPLLELSPDVRKRRAQSLEESGAKRAKGTNCKSATEVVDLT
jgi:hypothetical protein